uniref:Uncharacterized protein LOC111129426 n=1 Tax=Crassostrea virginica TaxID=6565 RepID=A0A8B8DVG5_CRAVI|nr:uncharacterized protein LOC111129426 [Crassostrea virginica]
MTQPTTQQTTQSKTHPTTQPTTQPPTTESTDQTTRKTSEHSTKQTTTESKQTKDLIPNSGKSNEQSDGAHTADYMVVIVIIGVAFLYVECHLLLWIVRKIRKSNLHINRTTARRSPLREKTRCRSGHTTCQKKRPLSIPNRCLELIPTRALFKARLISRKTNGNSNAARIP